MYFLYVSTFACFVLLLRHSGTLNINTCVDPSQLPGIKHGQQLAHEPFKTVRTSGLLTCVKQCLLRSRCWAVNYHNVEKTCSFLPREKNPKFVQQKDFVSTEIKHWKNTSLAGLCKDHECSKDSYCDDKSKTAPLCISERPKTDPCNPNMHFYPEKNVCLKSCGTYGYSGKFTVYKSRLIEKYAHGTTKTKSLETCRDACLETGHTNPCVLCQYNSATHSCYMLKKEFSDISDDDAEADSRERDWTLCVRQCGRRHESTDE